MYAKYYDFNSKLINFFVFSISKSIDIDER